ncbi:MAG: hypothetical protein ACRD19_15680 [Terriglobia bacterium]
MRWNVRAAVLALSIGLIAVGAQGQSQAPQMPMGGVGSQPSSKVTAQEPAPLEISFDGRQEVWTPAKLAALPQTTVKVYNEHAKAEQTYSGVPLIDLLTRLGVPSKPRGKQFRLYLIAEGSDGYQVVYSLGEVTPDVHAGTVMVADTMDGKPIGEDGPLKIISTEEKRPGRWVRNLVAIRVLTAE